MPGDVGWRDEHGLVHLCKVEALWMNCGQSVIAMIDLADGVPVTCLSCLVGYDPFKDLHERIVAAVGLPAAFLGA